MGTRKSTPEATETAVLAASRRRCCLCAALHQDFNVKQGQLAHLDQNPSNSDFSNLAFLCLAHHDQYDGKTSQSKGFTVAEVKQYRDLLYSRFAEEGIGSVPAESFAGGGFDFHDTKLNLLYRVKSTILKFLDVRDGETRSIEYAIDDPVDFAEDCHQVLGHESLGGVALPIECPRCHRQIYKDRGAFSSGGPPYHLRYYVRDLKRSVFGEIRRLRSLGHTLEGQLKSDQLIYPEMKRGW